MNLIKQIGLAAWLAVFWATGARAADTGASESLGQSMIWSPSAPPGQQAYVAFRKSFSRPENPGAATLHLFADSRYILWVNGKYALRGPCRFNPKQPEYDSVDLGPFLQTGSNTLAVLVHHYARAINGRIMQHAPGLTARLDIAGREVLRTDASWSCSHHTEYRPSPEAWSSIPDVLDGRLWPGDWTAPGFAGSGWEPAVKVDGGQWGRLQPRGLPLPRETELAGLKLAPSGRSLESALPLQLSAGQEVVVDLGRMAMAYAIVELEADAGSILQIQYALRFVNGKPAEAYGVGTTYTARQGRQQFMAADQWCSHYLTLKCVSGRLAIQRLKMMDRRYPFERLGRFQCSDPLLNRLWDYAVNTLEAVCDDAYGSDARERDEWLQDPAEPNFITTRVALAGPGPDGKPVYSDPRLLKNLLRHAAQTQLPDGRILATFPTDRGPEDCHYFIEDYACQWVEALRLYYEATQDAALVRELWPVLVKQLDWFLQRRTARGLVLAREYTSFDDPLAYITCEGAALNAFICQALRDAATLALAIDEKDQGKNYTQAASALASAFNQQLWNAAEGTYHAGFVNGQLLGPTAHAALLALDRGLVPEDRRESTRKWFLRHYQRPGGFHCGQNPDYAKMVAERAGINMPVVYYWVFQELYRMDSPAMDLEALNEMRRRWGPMVQSSDAGTLWETFEGSESCHNYGAVPAYFLSSFVLGVRLDGPVWNRRLVIEPRLGNLAHAEGVVLTEFGPVPVSWKREQDSLFFRFEVPPGIQATLRIPDADGSLFTLDGRQAHGPVLGRGTTAVVGEGVHAGRIALKPAPSASRSGLIQCAQDAPPQVRLAAREIRRYLYLRTGQLLPIRAEKPGPAEPSFQLETDTALQPAQYRLRTAGAHLAITGGSPLAVLYGAYAFAEKLGVRFQLDGDVLPDGRIAFEVPQLDETHTPLFKLRGIQPFHDFCEGPDFWNLGDYQAYLAQLTKMKMNFIGLHSYPWFKDWKHVPPEPGIWIGLPGDVDPHGRVQFSYPASWANTARRGPLCPVAWGHAPEKTSNFSFGAAEIFERDDFGGSVMDGLTPWPRTPGQCNELFNRVGDLYGAAFGFARSLGVKTCLGTETPFWIPDELRERIKSQGRDPGDPAVVRELFQGMFKRLASSHPPDYFWVWTPERDLDPAKTVADLRLAAEVSKEMRAPWGLAVSGWGWLAHQFVPFDQQLPKEIAFSCINDQLGAAPVTAEFSKLGQREHWCIPWMEDDSAMTLPQLWAGRALKDAADARRYGCSGLMGIHWRTRAIAPNLGALAQAAWTREPATPADPHTTPQAGGSRTLPPDDFYAAWGDSQFGPQAGPEAARIFTRMDGRLPRPADWPFDGQHSLPCGPGSVAKADPRLWETAQKDFAFADEFSALRPKVSGAGCLERFDYWDNQFGLLKAMARFRCTRAVIDRAMDALAKTSAAEKESALATALAARQRLVADWGEMMTHLLQAVSTPGEMGTVANLELHSRKSGNILGVHDDALEKALGRPLPAECAIPSGYLGKPRLVVPTVRSILLQGEALPLKIIALNQQPVKSVTVRMRPLGGTDWREIPAAHEARAVWRAVLPAAGDDFEYWIECQDAAGTILRWPATAPEANQTVVIHQEKT